MSIRLVNICNFQFNS